MTCPNRSWKGFSNYTCGAKPYTPRDGEPPNDLGECKRHYNVTHKIGKRYDDQRDKQERHDRLLRQSAALIEALGCGFPHRDAYGNPTGGVVLTALDAQDLVREFER